MISDIFPVAETGRSARSIYLALAEIASDRQSDTFDASQDEIAHRARSSVTTVKRVMPTLSQVGLVTVKRNFINKIERRSTYTLIRGALAHHELAPVQPSKTRRATEEECSEESVPLGVNNRIHVPRNLRGTSKSAARAPATASARRSTSSSSSSLKPKARERSIVPSLSEVHAYGLEIDLTRDDCEAFFDHHSARDWRFKGGQKMKDFRAALRTWKRLAPSFAKADDDAPSKPRYLPSCKQQREARLRAKEAEEKAAEEGKKL